MRMPEDNQGSAPADSRYRALLNVSAALVEQPTVKAVLHSLREVLSSSVRLHGADLYLLDSDKETLHVLEFDREADAPAIKVGTKISRIGAAAQALEQQEPVFLADVSQEMLKHPELAPFAAQSVGRSTHMVAARVRVIFSAILSLPKSSPNSWSLASENTSFIEAASRFLRIIRPARLRPAGHEQRCTNQLC
jgi:hypothetical protein